MKAFLHIGSHKTGTTAIQDFGAANTDWLLERGLGYPNWDLIGDLTKGLASDSAQNAKVFLTAARRDAEERGCNLLFSAESLFRLAPSHVDMVCDAFGAAFKEHEIVVVCSLRGQEEFAESLYRNGYRAYVRQPVDFAFWLNSGMQRFDYHRIVSAYAEKLGARVRLLPYSAANKTTFVSDFFATMGVEGVNADVGVRQKNPSLDIVDCLAKRIVIGDNIDAQPFQGI